MSDPRPDTGHPTSTRFRWLGWIAVAGLALAAVAAPASAAATDGNNGTVKIHEGSTETEPIVRNEPHVCTFHLHFFFADPFDAGTWEIQEWSPGDKGDVVLSGTYNTNGSGEDRDPNSSVYELPDGHYKLFWDGDQDAQKHDKHKVFWVECEAVNAPTPTFFGGEGDVTDGPGLDDLTQAPTDTSVPTVTPAEGGWQVLLIALAALMAVVLLATPSQHAARRR